MKPEEIEAVRKRNWPKGHQARMDRDALFAHIDAVEKKLMTEQMRRAELGAKSFRLEAENARLWKALAYSEDLRVSSDKENTKLRAVAEMVRALADVWTPE